MVILLPAYIGIQKGRINDRLSEVGFDINFELKELPSKFLPRSFQMRDIGNTGLPPVFCGSIINILVICFFINKKIKIKEKILTLAVFVIFFISFYMQKINLLWTLRKSSSILVI